MFIAMQRFFTLLFVTALCGCSTTPLWPQVVIGCSCEHGSDKPQEVTLKIETFNVGAPPVDNYALEVYNTFIIDVFKDGRNVPRTALGLRTFPEAVCFNSSRNGRPFESLVESSGFDRIESRCSVSQEFRLNDIFDISEVGHYNVLVRRRLNVAGSVEMCATEGSFDVREIKRDRK
jgi:hypothetical protein